MRIFKKIIFIICSVCLLLSCIGCKDSAPKTRVYFELPSIPSTVDPQTAHTPAELMLVRNLYEGLLRYDENGKLENGVAREYTQNGLTLTFKLREDASWDSGEPLLAEDFVFGMRRAVDPETRSPFVSRFYSIAGAEAINRGTQSVETLGVKATDKHTLVITLTREDDDLLHNLTTAPFMPCNEEFFYASVGKYGLERDCVLANGSYYLGKWNQETFGMRLYRNAEYYGEHSAVNGAVFLSCSDDKSALERLSEENVDAALLGSGEQKKAKELGFSTVSTENICWVLTLGSDLSANMRKSLMMLIDPQVYSIDLPEGFVAAKSFYPAAVNCEDVGSVGRVPYDPESAKKLFSEAVRALENKKLPPTALKYYSNAPIKDAVTSIVAHWQQNLSAFINIEAVDSQDAFALQLKEKSLTMALFPITADSASLKEYLATLSKSGTAAQAQTELLKDNSIVPIAFEQTTLAFSEKVEFTRLDPGNGHIDFAYVLKED